MSSAYLYLSLICHLVVLGVMEVELGCITDDFKRLYHVFMFLVANAGFDCFFTYF